MRIVIPGLGSYIDYLQTNSAYQELCVKLDVSLFEFCRCCSVTQRRLWLPAGYSSAMCSETDAKAAKALVKTMGLDAFGYVGNGGEMRASVREKR